MSKQDTVNISQDLVKILRKEQSKYMVKGERPPNRQELVDKAVQEMYK